MTEPIFARTRHTYDSYTDFWKLVELSGYKWVYVDEMDLHNSEASYIISPMNGEFEAHLDWDRGKQCTIYHWNLERPGGSGNLAAYITDNNRHVEQGMVDVIIVSDRQLAQDTKFHYVPVGSHPELGSPGHDKQYDFIHLMCYSLRRASTGLFNYIHPHTRLNGFSIAPNGWGDARHKALQASKYMLNVHQDSTLYMEPLRFALAAAYGLPIVTETVADAYPYGEANLLQFDLHNIHTVMESAMRSYDRGREVGEWTRARMTADLTFRKCLEAWL